MITVAPASVPSGLSFQERPNPPLKRTNATAPVLPVGELQPISPSERPIDCEDPNAALLLRGGSLVGCSESDFQCAIAELRQLHRQFVESGDMERAIRIRRSIDNAQAEHTCIDCRLVLDEEERAELEQCRQEFNAQIESVEIEWSGSARQSQFFRPSPTLTAMRKTAERLMNDGKYDPNSSIAKQISQREIEEQDIAQKRFQAAKAAEIARLNADYVATRAQITTDFEQRRNITAVRRHSRI
jgi:hypothetical protein